MERSASKNLVIKLWKGLDRQTVDLPVGDRVSVFDGADDAVQQQRILIGLGRVLPDPCRLLFPA